MLVWLWVGLATMFVSVLRIIIDFGVGLFGLHGTLSLTELRPSSSGGRFASWRALGATVAASPAPGSSASAALTNGFPIVYCPPVCEEARPLTDLGHVGCIVFGILLALMASGRPGAPERGDSGRIVRRRCSARRASPGALRSDALGRRDVKTGWTQAWPESTTQPIG